MTILKRVVYDNATGAIIKFGRTDFTGMYDTGTETMVVIDDASQWVEGVEVHHHKVAGNSVAEMNAAEKSAVDSYLEAKKLSTLNMRSSITRVVPNLAALPTPPPNSGVFVGVNDIGGSPGFVVSRNTDYMVFVSTGIHS